MARFEIDFLSEYTDEALLDELRRIAGLLTVDEPLTIGTFKRYSPKVSHDTIRRRFGGWKEALGFAGLGHLYSGHPVSQKMRFQPARGQSDADLIAELKRVFALVGKDWLTSDDFNAHSITSEDSVRRRFGTFRKGLDAAGIPHAPFKARQFTDQQCFENLADLWTHLARAPEYREMFKPPSRIQGKTYVLRWGTWRRALKAFVDWANSEDQPPVVDEIPSDSDVVQKPAQRTERIEADCREVRPGLRFKVFRRDRFRCVACGRSPSTHLNVELHADHVISVNDGGKTSLENLETLCADCNLGKGRTSIPRWESELKAKGES